MNFDIAIFYRDDTPEDLILGLKQELSDAGVNVKMEERPNEPIAAVELVPVVVLFLASQFVGGLLKEAAKDVYPKIKAATSKYAVKLLGIKQKVIVSSESPNKLGQGSPVSSSFSIWSEALDRRSIKFLFLSDRDESFYSNCTDEVYKVLLDHAQQYPNDQISKELEGIERHQSTISLVFDESLKVWKVVDNAALLAE